jgi:hypothetical protein
MPVTVIRPENEPRRPILMLSPTRAVALGSPTMAKSYRVALRGGPLQQLVGAVDRVGFLVIGDGERDASVAVCRVRPTAAMKAAMPLFMSAAPRP